MIYLELLNGILTIISVYLFSIEKRIGWLISIVACLSMGYLYTLEGLWFEFSIQFIFIFHSLDAYFHWGLGKKLDLTLCVFLYILGSCIPFFWINLHILNYSDMGLMCVSLIANHLMVLKIRFSWVLWLVFDSLSALLCLHLKLYVTFGLFIILTLICCKVLYEHHWGDASEKV